MPEDSSNSTRKGVSLRHLHVSTLKPFDERRVVTQLCRQNLQGNKSVEFGLACLIDGSHPTFAKQSKDLEVWEECRQVMRGTAQRTGGRFE